LTLPIEKVKQSMVNTNLVYIELIDILTN